MAAKRKPNFESRYMDFVSNMYIHYASSYTTTKCILRIDFNILHFCDNVIHCIRIPKFLWQHISLCIPCINYKFTNDNLHWIVFFVFPYIFHRMGLDMTVRYYPIDFPSCFDPSQMRLIRDRRTESVGVGVMLLQNPTLSSRTEIFCLWCVFTKNGNLSI